MQLEPNIKITHSLVNVNTFRPAHALLNKPPKRKENLLRKTARLMSVWRQTSQLVCQLQLTEQHINTPENVTSACLDAGVVLTLHSHRLPMTRRTTLFTLSSVPLLGLSLLAAANQTEADTPTQVCLPQRERHKEKVSNKKPASFFPPSFLSYSFFYTTRLWTACF